MGDIGEEGYRGCIGGSKEDSLLWACASLIEGVYSSYCSDAEKFNFVFEILIFLRKEKARRVFSTGGKVGY